MRVFVFGAGYSGKAFAAAKPAPAIRVAGTTRSREKLAALEAAGAAPFLFDGALSDEIRSELLEVTHLVISTAPDDAGDPVLTAARQVIAERMPRLGWIGYLSTVGVYGDHQGAWTDETAECRPVSARSRRRVEAEREWLALGAHIGLPVAVLRLSGIYGPGRNAFVNLRDGAARRLVKKDQVFNRIHVADIAGALWHLAGRKLGGVYNVTDDLPAPPQDVVAYAAELIGVQPPPEIAFEEAELSPMARSFYGENKRVSNALIRSTNYRFLYPDYRTAFSAMWADGSWAGSASDARSPIRQS
ncbi:SDR family oxidoreductase [Pseudaminobacter sp. 19-2017]|uniref:SDR family oxidoreductase n=1 Tax=Pseudaminobacter soli (ex Zhang et al. 2022) TaxID=2831468 RepID=A0A942E100_9HYPH|nr:SDR family oxidoreductase [Pseudaminobacter soli]MBS3649016.1 SDR family oxidoreductase [Pseudaminobacter soli]